MHSIQNNSKLPGDISGSSTNRAVTGSDGWDDKNELNLVILKIQAANRKVRLVSIFQNYNVRIKRLHKHQIWSTPTTCPLPGHKHGNERTPSFGYNFVQRRFNCFGCKKSGKAVEFIAEMEGKTRTAVATSILDHYGDADVEEDIEREDPRVEELLFSMGNFIRESIQASFNSPVKLKSIDKISWWFDMYLAVKVPARKGEAVSNLDVEELDARVSKAKSLLKEIVNEEA